MADAPAPPPPRRRLRWLRRIAIGLFLAAVLLVIASLLILENLDKIARFALERVLPGIRVEMGSLRAVSASRLEVRQLALRSARTGEPLLVLANGSASFLLTDVWRGKLEELRLDEPQLVVSPDLLAAIRGEESSPSASPPAFTPPPWSIGRLVIRGGRLRIERFGERSPALAAAVELDWRNFGFGGEAAERAHTLRLAGITGTTARDREFFRIGAAELTFTTGELLERRHLRRLKTEPGNLAISPGLLADLTPSSSSFSASPSPASAWSIGALEAGRLDVDLADAPGPIGRVRFSVAASLRDLDASRTGSSQSLTVTDLVVSPPTPESPPLLTARHAQAVFSLDGLSRREVERLTLVEPRLRWSPVTLDDPGSPAPATTPPTGPSPLPGWRVAHLECRYGTLDLTGLRDGAVDVHTKFSLVTDNFGTAEGAADVPHELALWDTRASAAGQRDSFLSLDVTSVTFTPGGLFEHQRIDAVRVKGGRLLVGSTLQSLLANDSPTPPPATPPSPATAGWSIAELDIQRVRARLEETRPGLSELRFTLTTSLTNINASGAASQLLEEEQMVEFSNITLRSPLDPDLKILSLRSVFVRFTLRGLARKHLRHVTILRPTIYLSQGLFVYMERATAGEAPAATPSGVPAAGPNWALDELDVKFGRLVLGGDGGREVGLPLEFETTATDLALDNLAKLQLQAALRVPRQSYEFPDYQLEVDDVEGELRFAYPPEKGEQNLVQRLDIGGVRWRQYRARKSWVAATFDARGINGLFGAEAYRGYVNGGFSFFFQADSPWIGWIAGTGVDTRSLTDVISPQNFGMTGALDFEVQLDAFRKRIGRVRGDFRVTEPGRFRIGKLDELIAEIPPDWPALKQSSTRIAMETLRDFDYTQASGDFWFVDSQGILSLDLSGPLGSRKFEVALHDDQDTNAPWQQGKLGNLSSPSAASSSSPRRPASAAANSRP